MSITNALEQNFQDNYNKLYNIVGRKPEIGGLGNMGDNKGISLLKLYGIIFVIILFALLLLRPSNLVTYETDKGSTKLDVFALFKYSFIFSIIILCVYKIP
jgi:hypothetical protein